MHACMQEAALTLCLMGQVYGVQDYNLGMNSRANCSVWPEL